MKVELNGNDLENIVGGQIKHTWDNNTGTGTIWLQARNPVVYTFRQYSIIGWITTKQGEGWSDQEIMDYLVANNCIQR